MADDPDLTDDALQAEIALVGALVLAASQVSGPMSQERIDEVLGVLGRPQRHPGPPVPSP